jgi:hypothetical protein
MQVAFIIAGTQKGGTTALDSYLRQHPDVCMARVKEPHFFDTDEYFTSHAVDYQHYHDFFPPDAAPRLCGEATPIYMYWHDAPRRIWEYNPKIKLILLLRNPITRAYSHWNMETRRAIENLSFTQALATEAERCRSAAPYQHRHYSYQDRGFYSEQLRRLWRFFPPAQTLVLKSEYLRQHPQRFFDQVCDFLHISHHPLILSHNIHALPYAHPISYADQEYLQKYYYYEIKQLQQMLSWDCRDWLDDTASLAH